MLLFLKRLFLITSSLLADYAVLWAFLFAVKFISLDMPNVDFIFLQRGCCTRNFDGFQMPVTTLGFVLGFP